MQILSEIFISVITPVYNREDCIGRCIESVVKQYSSERSEIYGR